MSIILLQAMMAFPVVAILIFLVTFLLSFVTLLGYNAFMGRNGRKSSQKVNPFWVSFGFALLVLAFFVYKLLTFKGPWITRNQTPQTRPS